MSISPILAEGSFSTSSQWSTSPSASCRLSPLCPKSANDLETAHRTRYFCSEPSQPTKRLSFSAATSHSLCTSSADAGDLVVHDPPASRCVPPQLLGLWVHNPIALGEAIRNVTQLSASVLPSAPPLGLRVSHKFQATFTITPPTPRLPRGMPATPRQPQPRHGVVFRRQRTNHETVVHVLL